MTLLLTKICVGVTCTPQLRQRQHRHPHTNPISIRGTHFWSPSNCSSMIVNDDEWMRGCGAGATACQDIMMMMMMWTKMGSIRSLTGQACSSWTRCSRWLVSVSGCATEDVGCSRWRPNSEPVPGSAVVVGQTRRLAVACGVVRGRWRRRAVSERLCEVVWPCRRTSDRSTTALRGLRNSLPVYDRTPHNSCTAITPTYSTSAAL